MHVLSVDTLVDFQRRKGGEEDLLPQPSASRAVARQAVKKNIKASNPLERALARFVHDTYNWGVWAILLHVSILFSETQCK